MGTLEAIEDRYISDQKEEDHSHKEYQDACTTVNYVKIIGSPTFGLKYQHQ